MVEIENVSDVALNFIDAMSVFPEFAATQAFITAELVLNPSWSFILVDDDDRLAFLRQLTAFTVSLRPDFNCYPRGDVETRCYDLNGDPVP